MVDIIFPKNNEKEFIEIAEKLKIKELFLAYLYKKDTKDIKEKKEILKELNSNTKISLKLALIAETKDIPKAKQKCDFVMTESSEKDQYVMEKQKPNLIFDLEKDPRRDKTHYRLSGLNQVLCKLAAQNKITIAFSFSGLLNSRPKKRAILLGRMIQNMRFCRKFKVDTLFASFAKQPYELRSGKDLKAFSRVLRKNL